MPSYGFSSSGGAHGIRGVIVVNSGLSNAPGARGDPRAAASYARSLIEASLDPLVTISPAGTITDVNKATEEATGLGRGELIGREFAEYFTNPQAARAGYERVLRDGEVRDYPLTLRHVSGSTIDVLYNGTVYRDESGAVLGVFAAARDITELKRAEAAIRELNASLEERVRERTAALRESEARFRAIAAHSPDHLLVQDTNLRYVFVMNPQLGLTEQDMLGKTDHDFLAKDDADKLVAAKRRVMESGEPLHLETTLLSRSGKQDWFDGTYVPRRGEDGRVDGLIGYFRNITERKRTEEELRRRAAELQAANEELARFNRVAVGRELRMIELKQEVNEYCRRLGLPPRYGVAGAAEAEAPGNPGAGNG